MNAITGIVEMKIYPIDYLIEKFEQAVDDLATGEGDARSRVDAALHRFSHFLLDDFPQELREKRVEITRLLTRIKGGKVGIIPHNLQRMKNKTASKVARLIWEIYIALVQIRDKEKEQ